MADHADMRTWIIARAGAWRGLVQSVADLKLVRRATVDEAVGAVESYRGLARDLATARRLAPNSRTTAGLESLYAQLHALITRKPRGGMAALLDLLRIDIPGAARELRSRIAGMALLMAASAAAGWWLIATFPALISIFASEAMIEQVEQGRLWTDGMINIIPSSILSVGILANNIVVSVLAFCAGIFLGLGTFYLVALNGLMLGAVFTFVHQHGLAGALFKFIIAHGPVELSVICIAGATGVALGESIIRPALATRRDSFQACAHRVAPLLLLCAALLIGCGFIEGFVSPDPSFPLVSRVTIGISYWTVMWILMSGRLFRQLPSGSRESQAAALGPQAREACP
ncbi:MAG TPA: stage II sporulation protein M [Steroidobacteraceae bacterium]|nr:stage II sporulation protein M [Steroidobacteraceae bacterium]